MKGYLITLGGILLLSLLIALAMLNSDKEGDSTDDAERQALASEGKFLTSEMERANREHDWSRVREIRERNADFQRRREDYLRRHGRTPPPRR